jgi:molybdopterin-guanine dinucleotide biosynthesis protein A
MAMRNKLSVVIQAGGQSTRMGADKGLLKLSGKPLVQWIVDQVRDLADEILLISNQPDNYLPLGWPVYGDVIPDIGALGGLYTAVSIANYEIVLVLACDMPFINKKILQAMLAYPQSCQVVIPRLQDPNALEPFRARYHKSCQQPILDAIQTGKRRAISFFPDVQVCYYPWEEIHRLDPHALSFFNINTPDDLQQAEEIATTLPEDG